MCRNPINSWHIPTIFMTLTDIFPPWCKFFDWAHGSHLKKGKKKNIVKKSENASCPSKYTLVWYGILGMILVWYSWYDISWIWKWYDMVFMVWYWYDMVFFCMILVWYSWYDISWIWKWLVVCAPGVIFLPQWVLCQWLLLSRNLYAFKCCLIRGCLQKLPSNVA